MNSSPLRRTLNTAKTFRQWYRQIQASSTSRFRNHTTNSASVAADKSFDTESKFDNYISGKSTHFGYESVNVKDKEGRVRMVFDKVADSYDIMNDMMRVARSAPDATALRRLRQPPNREDRAFQTRERSARASSGAPAGPYGFRSAR